MSDPDIFLTLPMPGPSVSSTSSARFVALAAEDARSSARTNAHFERLRTMLPTL